MEIMEKVFQNEIPQRGYIYKRDNDIYYLCFSASEQRIRKSLNTDNYYQALKKSFKVIDEIINGVTKTPMFKMVVKEFLVTIASQATKKYYAERLYGTFLNHFKYKKINEISEKDINFYIFQRLEKVKPQTINRELIVLRQLLKFSFKKGYILQIPTVENVKAITNKRDSFTDEEIKELIITATRRIDEIINQKQKFEREILLQYILFLMQTGVRTGEAVSIQLKNISGDYAKLGKSKTLIREIYINESAKKVIDAIKTIYEKYKIALNNDSFLFLNHQGKPISSLKKSFNALLSCTSMSEMVGKNQITLYSLRHFYITKALKSGIPLTTIAIQCGTSLKMIQKNYNHLTIHQVENDLK